MGRLAKILIAAFAVFVVGGIVFLATWDIPAPAHQVEKVLDDSRFPR